MTLERDAHGRATAFSFQEPTQFVMPTPNAGEGEEYFISRCMGDELMVSEYPDNEQRAAVCYSQLRST